MTYLDNFIDELLKDKPYAYELFVNIYDNNSVVFFNDNGRKIEFNKKHINYNDDKDENKLNKLCELFKNDINYLINKHIDYDYIKLNCLNILEKKINLMGNKSLTKDDYDILHLHWFINNLNNELENYINLYFKDQNIISTFTL